jgi:predicted transcriptional regulator
MEMSVRTVTISVASRRAVNGRFRSAMRGKAQGSFITFASPTLLWRTLTAKRMEMLQAMAGRGPLTIRQLARLVRRDVKSVHGDVGVLVSAGVLDKTEDGVEFPYDAVHVDFTLNKAA